jgi:ATP-dependent DNA helicase RecQ
MGHVIDVLRGSNNQRIQALGHTSLSTFGIGKNLSNDAWGSLIRQLVHLGYLAQDIANYSTLRLTAKSRPLLRGEERLTLARPRGRITQEKKEPKDRSEGFTYDEALFQELRTLRKQFADEQQVPPFVVFSDATLMEMAASRPVDAAGFSRLTGVGKHKLGRYGAQFLRIIQEFTGASGVSSCQN